MDNLKSVDEAFPTLDQGEYARWWMSAGIDEDGPLTRTLAQHVLALQDKIDALPVELRCACAYDHPADICMMHKAVIDQAGQ